MNRPESGLPEPGRAGQISGESPAPVSYAPIAGPNDISSNGEQSRKLGNVRQLIGVCFALSVLIAFIYTQTKQFDFVNFDDDTYVYENQRVLGGLSVDNLAWAFTTTHAWNWHPLTWISYMVDVEIYKVGPRGHHITNVLIHMATTIVLFLAFRRLTGNWRCSAFVAAVFAVHPLRVESVAWISERKDVLSGFFFALVLFAYAGYGRRPSPWRYALMTLAFVLGLMSKPMLVTVPFVLLLLDYWPLERLLPINDQPSAPSLGRLVIEKAPLLVLAAAASALTVYAQDTAIQSIGRVSLTARLSNAGVSYVAYIRQMIWPSDLAVFYKHPADDLPAWQATSAWLTVIGATVAALAVRRRRPYLLVGWLWYLGMLVPVIGLVQVGEQARADRYTYLPEIGLVMAAAWWLADLSASWRIQRPALVVAAVGLIAVLSWSAQRQTSTWRNGVTMWSRAVARNPRNVCAQYYLGRALELQERFQESIPHFQAALDCDPSDQLAQYGLGHAWGSLGHYQESIPHFRAVLAVNPNSRLASQGCGIAFFNLGKFDDAEVYLRRWVELDPSSVPAKIVLGETLYRLGRIDEAESVLQPSLNHDPPYAQSHDCLGLIRARQGRWDEAVAEHRAAIELDPKKALWRAHLGIALNQSGKPRDAMSELRDAIRSGPDDMNVLRIAAWTAATSPDDTIRSGVDAVSWSRKAVELSRGQDPLILDCLAASYAEVREFAAAVEQADRALDLAASRELGRLADAIRAHRAVYQSKKPLRERPSDIWP
jgi:protein O-mannosyl-transferase